MMEWEPWLQPGELEAFEAFEQPDPAFGEIDAADLERRDEVPYWVWHQNRLVPAPPEKVARIQEIEALRRLEIWKRRERLIRQRDTHSRRLWRAAEWLRDHAKVVWAVCATDWQRARPREASPGMEWQRRASLSQRVEE